MSDNNDRGGGICCAEAKWKREEIPDHKFDYIDVDDFTEDNWVRKFQYGMIFLVTLKSILVYMADIVIVALLFVNNSFQGVCSNNTGVTVVACTSNPNTVSQTIMPNKVRPWLILVTVFLSFILLLIDWRKAQAIIRSRDISYAFTSPIAYRYYALRSYPHYCFFSQIQNSRKTVDVLAFFVFFSFKGWKRLLLAEFPRQLLNALNLNDIINAQIKPVDPNNPDQPKQQNIFEKYIDGIKVLINSSTNTLNLIVYGLSTFTVLMWCISFLGLLAAFFIYIPLLCNIRGNLKEYCCHKIDKRIGELLRKKSRKRTEEARKAELAEIERNNILKARARAAGGGGGSGSGQSTVGGTDSENGSMYNGSDGTGNKAAPPMGLTQRPTLPDIDIDLDAPPTMIRPNGGPGGYGNPLPMPPVAGSGMYPPPMGGYNGFPPLGAPGGYRPAGPGSRQGGNGYAQSEYGGSQWELMSDMGSGRNLLNNGNPSPADFGTLGSSRTHSPFVGGGGSRNMTSPSPGLPPMGPGGMPPPPHPMMYGPGGMPARPPGGWMPAGYPGGPPPPGMMGPPPMSPGFNGMMPPPPPGALTRMGGIPPPPGTPMMMGGMGAGGVGGVGGGAPRSMSPALGPGPPPAPTEKKSQVEQWLSTQTMEGGDDENDEEEADHASSRSGGMDRSYGNNSVRSGPTNTGSGGGGYDNRDDRGRYDNNNYGRNDRNDGNSSNYSRPNQSSPPSGGQMSRQQQQSRPMMPVTSAPYARGQQPRYPSGDTDN